MNDEKYSKLLDEHGYTFIKKLGKGAFGISVKAENKVTKDIVAIKMVKKKKIIEKNMMKFYQREKEISLKLKHKNLMRTYEFFENEEYGCLVCEFCSGGEIANFLEKYYDEENSGFPEKYVQHLMRQIVDGIKYMHENHYMHRDLKLENIMVNFETEEDKQKMNMLKATVKIIDFGFARSLNEGEYAESLCGSAPYMDPIILKRFARQDNDKTKYSYEADIWSLGVICYQMLIGSWPFDANSISDLFDKITKGKYRIPHFLREETISFINCMLQQDPKKRAKIQKLANHDFLKKDLEKLKKITLGESIAFNVNDKNEIKNMGKGFWLVDGTKEEGGSNVDLTTIETGRDNTPSYQTIKEEDSSFEQSSLKKGFSGEPESGKEVSSFGVNKNKEEEEEAHYVNENDEDKEEEDAHYVNENDEDKEEEDAHYVNSGDEEDKKSEEKIDIDSEMEKGFAIMNNNLIYTKPKLLSFIPEFKTSNTYTINES